MLAPARLASSKAWSRSSFPGSLKKGRREQNQNTKNVSKNQTQKSRKITKLSGQRQNADSSRSGDLQVKPLAIVVDA